VRVTCAWCGASVRYAGRGPRPRYCPRPRPCRQRAYEVRTAETRYGRDVAAGRLRTEPVQVVTERIVQPKHPSTAGGWTSALDALTEQLRTGSLGWQHWHHPQLRAALRRALAALGDDPAVPAPAAPVTLDAAALRVAQHLQFDGGARPVVTTLDRLAARTGQPVDDVRAALGTLTALRYASVSQPGPAGVQPVDVAAVASHKRITVTTTTRP
jgi:hypothetical protein